MDAQITDILVIRMGKDSVLLEKSMGFAVRMVKLSKYLRKQGEYELSSQILRSGTSVGANLREAVYGQSREDFMAKARIALKEASETEYWLELLYKAEVITEAEFQSLNNDCSALMRMLIATVSKA